MRCPGRDLNPITERVITPEGFLVAPGTIGRTGVQVYLARELGLDKQGMAGDKRIRLYRPPEEVFAAATIASFENQTITNDHPSENVNAQNWKKVSIGDIRDVARSGDFLRARLTIRDAAAIKRASDGKSQLSCGYEFDLDLTPGTSPEGEPFDGIQRAIVGNHVALVDVARGGRSCNIADHQSGEKKTMARRVIVDGKPVDFENETHAAIVEQAERDRVAAVAARDAAVERIAAAEEAVSRVSTAAEAATKKLIADHSAALDVATKRAEKAEALATPEAIEKAASERQTVVSDAAIIDKELDCKGKSVAQIRVAALEKLIAGDAAEKSIVSAILKGEPAKVDAAVATIAFDAAVASLKAGKPASSGNAGGEADIEAARALVGKDSAPGTQKLTGRDAWLAKQLAGGEEEQDS